jgi:hypothetical protein
VEGPGDGRADNEDDACRNDNGRRRAWPRWTDGEENLPAGLGERGGLDGRHGSARGGAARCHRGGVEWAPGLGGHGGLGDW